MINILIRYLGIKTKILAPIRKAISNVTPNGAVVLDLFAGSNTVGQYLINDYCVLSNDCQRYSYTAAKALIEYHSRETINRICKGVLYSDFYRQNYERLTSMFALPLAKEKELLDQIGDTYYGPQFDEYVDFFDHSPYYGHTENKHPSYADCLNYYSTDHIAAYQSDHSLFPYILFTAYYGNPYFSLHQCVEIDSLMYSLQIQLKNGMITAEEYNIYLSFIIYSLNLTVISVGDHFAQPQKIKPVTETLDGPRDRINLRERKKIISKKRTIIESLIDDKITDYKSSYIPGNVHNRAFCMDFKELLKSGQLAQLNLTTVYVDPPYTNAHYSRFYHIPETLVAYDYPDIEYSGRYRTDRYQSGFCIRSEAMHEFKTMIELCEKSNLNIVISYSDTAQCILAIDEIECVCKEFYKENVVIENVAHMYRNFGQKPNRVLAKEYIITCCARE